MPVLDPNDPVAVARYDEFVRSSPFRTMTQDRAWAHVKSEWGSEQVFVEREGELVAAMSLLVRKVAGQVLLYAPRGPVCDQTDVALVAEVVEEARVVAEKHKAFLLKLDPEVRHTDELRAAYEAQGWTVHGRETDEDHDELIQPRYAMVLHLEDHDAESIMGKFKPKTRTLIRKCVKDGVHTTWSRDEKDLRTFFDIYQQMSARKGIAARDFPYFQRLLEAFPEARVYLTHHEDDILSAAVTIDYFGRFSYLYAGSTDVKRRLNPNHLMNYDMIRWAIESGGETYDFGGVFTLDTSDGLYIFKNAFVRTDGVTEYLGEVDIVLRPAVAWAFQHLVPRVKKGRRGLLNLRRQVAEEGLRATASGQLRGMRSRLPGGTGAAAETEAPGAAQPGAAGSSSTEADSTQAPGNR